MKKHPGTSQAELEAYTASVIKHFELYFEMLWKFYKAYLFDKYGSETTGSKTVFKACMNNKIINEQELEQLLEIVEIRNATTHVYNEENAQELCAKIDNHYAVLKKLTESVNFS